jgi:hypothetical protein
MNRRLAGNRLVNHNRKSQLEMIGLIIIVIIVITAMLIYTVNKVSNPAKNQKKIYMNKELANNLLLTMTKTTMPDCPSNTLGDLIADCAKEYHIIICAGITSCEQANQTLSLMLNKTLDVFGNDYKLVVQNTDLKFIKGCTASKSKISGFQILPLFPGQAEVNLTICD